MQHKFFFPKSLYKRTLFLKSLSHMDEIEFIPEEHNLPLLLPSYNFLGFWHQTPPCFWSDDAESFCDSQDWICLPIASQCPLSKSCEPWIIMKYCLTFLVIFMWYRYESRPFVGVVFSKGAVWPATSTHGHILVDFVQRLAAFLFLIPPFTI